MVWNATRGAPLSAKVGGFVCMSLGLGMVSQMPPKLQIPVEYHENSAVTASTQPTEQSTNDSSFESKQSGWKVRCPFDFTDNKNPDSNAVRGLERISRHPGLWSFAFLGLGAAFLTPSLPQRLWFAMPSMVALCGGAHTDSRYRRGMGGTLDERYDEITSNVPFWAILNGSQGEIGSVLREMSEEIKPLNAAIAVGVAGAWVLKRGRGMKLPVR